MLLVRDGVNRCRHQGIEPFQNSPSSASRLRTHIEIAGEIDPYFESLGHVIHLFRVGHKIAKGCPRCNPSQQWQPLIWKTRAAISALTLRKYNMEPCYGNRKLAFWVRILGLGEG